MPPHHHRAVGAGGGFHAPDGALEGQRELPAEGARHVAALIEEGGHLEPHATPDTVARELLGERLGGDADRARVFVGERAHARADPRRVLRELFAHPVFEQTAPLQRGRDGLVLERFLERLATAAVGRERLPGPSRLLVACRLVETSGRHRERAIPLLAPGGRGRQPFEHGQRPDFLALAVGLEANALEADIRGRADLAGQIVLDLALPLAGHVDHARLDLHRDLAREIRRRCCFALSSASSLPVACAKPTRYRPAG